MQKPLQKRILWYSLFLLLVFSTFLAFAAEKILNSPTNKKAILLNIQGGVGPATADFIERGIAQAKRESAAIIVLKIDTPGGLSLSMRNIIQAILASPIPVIGYVTPSGARAASAGTFILYACHIAAMSPGTNLGAATPVSIQGPQTTEKKATPKTDAEIKAINDAKAYIRSLAQLRQRNAEWATAAVEKGESISASEALQLKVINLMADNVSDLLQKINDHTVSVQGRLLTLQTNNLTVQVLQPDWRSKFLSIITDPSVAYILLLIGIYGIFFEFANPGFVLPGVAGGIALLLALYAFQLLPINYVALGLILLGLFFIIAEAFMPSGVLAIGGVVSFVIGSIMLLKTDAGLGKLPLSLILLAAGVSVAFLLLVLNMVLRSQTKPVVSGREGLIGALGVVKIISDHYWVHVAGEDWQYISNEELVEGQEVIVTGVDGLKLRIKVKQ